MAEKRLTFTGKDTTVYRKKGGWSEVQTKGISFNLRTPTALDIISKSKHMRYSTEGDRLYSYWIDNTKAGKLYTARRQVEGMLKTAKRKGWDDMVDELEEVLTHSDEYVWKFRENWEAKTSDVSMEEFYEYDPGMTDFERALYG